MPAMSLGVFEVLEVLRQETQPETTGKFDSSSALFALQVVTRVEKVQKFGFHNMKSELFARNV